MATNKKVFGAMRIHRRLAVGLFILFLNGFAEGAENMTQKASEEVATFAGGCFWCMEPAFEELDGVHDVVSGYTGGKVDKPTYEEVSDGETGHAEAIQVTYDPQKVAYEKLLDIFWQNIDPTAKDRQFADVGSQYRSGIFYHNETQRQLAEKSREALAQSGRFKDPIVTEITPAQTFYPAEDYHQDYHKKNPMQYKFYRSGSGRDQFLSHVWGKTKHK